MQEKFCDVASYQPSSREFFQAMVNNGVKAVVVKLTQGSRDGDNYVNPKARTQVENARAVGLRVHFYHYFKGVNEADSRNEARFFVETAKNIGFDTNETVMVCDVEDNCLSKNKNSLTYNVNCFFDEVKKLGCPHVDIYTGSSWAYSRLNMNDLIPKNIWLASYGIDRYVKPDNFWKTYKAWQYAGDPQYYGAQYYNGSVCDTNWDFSGMYTRPISQKKKNGEYKEGNEWYYYIDGVKQKNHWQYIAKDDKTIYCGSSGAYVRGEQHINDHWYYFEPFDGRMVRGFKDLGSKTCYYNQDGWMLYGWQDIGGKRYYFDRFDGAMMKNVKFDRNGVYSSL